MILVDFIFLFCSQSDFLNFQILEFEPFLKFISYIWFLLVAGKDTFFSIFVWVLTYVGYFWDKYLRYTFFFYLSFSHHVLLVYLWIYPYFGSPQFYYTFLRNFNEDQVRSFINLRWMDQEARGLLLHTAAFFGFHSKGFAGGEGRALKIFYWHTWVEKNFGKVGISSPRFVEQEGTPTWVNVFVILNDIYDDWIQELNFLYRAYHVRRALVNLQDYRISKLYYDAKFKHRFDEPPKNWGSEVQPLRESVDKVNPKFLWNYTNSSYFIEQSYDTHLKSRKLPPLDFETVFDDEHFPVSFPDIDEQCRLNHIPRIGQHFSKNYPDHACDHVNSIYQKRLGFLKQSDPALHERVLPDLKSLIKNQLEILLDEGEGVFHEKILEAAAMEDNIEKAFIRAKKAHKQRLLEAEEERKREAIRIEILRADMRYEAEQEEIRKYGRLCCLNSLMLIFWIIVVLGLVKL